ncbi:hypothetical protein ASE86_13085 [Sphingomonas sp. Leaf33]|nr:hypothetical protein ASE86_13085 [Sphingomonas sp. Leaf33]
MSVVDRRRVRLWSLLALSLTLAAPATAGTIGQDAAACDGNRGPAIAVTVEGLKDRRGEMWLELYPANDADFLADDHELAAAGKVFRRTRAPLPTTGAVAMCVKVPRPGRYALLLRHNRVDRDKFSFWSDGVGVPGTTRLGRSKPTIDQAAVSAGAGVTTTSIRLQYLRGFGFSALSGE